MGRHSAPDDDDIDDVADVVVDPSRAPAPGSRPRPARHADPAGSQAPAQADTRTDPSGIPPQSAPPSARFQPDDGGRIGRALPRPGGVVRSAAARTGPAPREQPERPPADDDTSPGIAMIERALAGSRPTPLVDARDAPDELPEATDETAQIPIIADPVLDEPVPEAVTENLRPVPAAPIEHGEPTSAATEAHDADADAAKPDKAAKKAKKAAKVGASTEGRISDAALLRSDSAVRARVAAAVVVPFVLYVAVLLVLDAFDVRTALIWIWIPLISAGVVGGLILDMAHRGAAASAAVTEPTADDQRTESPERTAP